LVAAVHAVVFALIFHFTSGFVGDVGEGFVSSGSKCGINTCGSAGDGKYWDCQHTRNPYYLCKKPREATRCTYKNIPSGITYGGDGKCIAALDGKDLMVPALAFP
jgi:hypothetical protein